MAWLALGYSVGRRRGSGGHTLRRPALGREIDRDLAKIFLRKTFGYGRHNRVVAIATSVVVQLLDEIALLLTPDDRNGFWVNGYAILAVACAALGNLKQNETRRRHFDSWRIRGLCSRDVRSYRMLFSSTPARDFQAQIKHGSSSILSP
jgi:hypothetical protein